MTSAATSRVDEPDDWIPIEEAAIKARLSLSTLYRKIREGVLPAYQATGRTVLRKADFAAFLAPKPIAINSKGQRKNRKPRSIPRTAR